MTSRQKTGAATLHAVANSATSVAVSEQSVPEKPRLVFFQYRYDERLPAFLLLHTLDHVKCLSQFFDVTVIREDCDYDAVCDRYEPAVTLFEAGVNHVTCRRPNIANTGSHARIPKLGLHNADAFCNARAGFLSDMDRWGIETFFAICTTAAEHTPEIADNLFVWPNFVDPELYRDYGAWKSIPVLLIGNTIAAYPWRRTIGKLLLDRFASLVCPHPGYSVDASPVDVLYGERYARTLNASSIVPTCGTVAREVVRKHFEIPACRACLVTERSQGLQSAGFTDMVNCVFADEHDVVDKVLTLFRTPEALDDITRAGYQLVHARHTLRQRSQILQWVLLRRRLQPHERIVQVNPFDPLAIVPASAGASSHIRGDGLHLALLRDGDLHFRRGRYGDAARLYARCINYISWMPEPRLRLALCKLCEGDARGAQSLIESLLAFGLGEYGAFDPDPVEWAYFIVTALCLGRIDEARERAHEFPWMRHPELDRARWLATVASGGRDPMRTDGTLGKHRPTIHQLPDRAFDEWVHRVRTMLCACGRRDVADTTNAVLAANAVASTATRHSPDAEHRDAPDPERLGVLQQCRRWSRDSRRTFRRRVTYRALIYRARRLAATMVRRCGVARHGRIRDVFRSPPDPLFRTIVALIREEPLASALIVGAASRTPSTHAFLSEASRSAGGPTLFCISRAESGPAADLTGCATPRWYVLPAGATATIVDSITRTVRAIRDERQCASFDAVVIDTTGLDHALSIDVLGDELHSTNYVILDGINGGNHENFQRMIADPEYRLVACDPAARHGYGVFRRQDRHTAA